MLESNATGNGMKSFSHERFENHDISSFVELWASSGIDLLDENKKATKNHVPFSENMSLRGLIVGIGQYFAARNEISSKSFLLCGYHAPTATAVRITSDK